MRLVLTEFMSLDGVVQAPGGEQEDPEGGFRHGGWAAPYYDPEVMGGAIDELMELTDAFLFGRRTYELVASSWSQRTDDEQAERFRAVPKYVVSRSLDEGNPLWHNTIVLGGDRALAAVRRLKADANGTLTVMGSADLARQLVAEGMVDEYRVMIEPVLLGGGKRCFPEDRWKRPLRLVSSHATPTGVLVAVYRAQ